MKLTFTKMHGCGNDYIYFNCFETEVLKPEALAIKLSNRHFGVGGDGIVLIMPSIIADAKMRMFNADGSEGKMCGNAIRCVAKYLYEHNLVKKDKLCIETLSGIKELFLTVKDDSVTQVKVNMGKAELYPPNIPVAMSGETVINRPISVNGKEENITCVSMGNPHAVLFCDNVDGLDLPAIGPGFENHLLFPERINTEFIKVIDKNTLQMRVWERGSGETWACGTGACASVVAAVLNGYCKKGEDVRVHLRGGDLIINYTDEAVYMTGGCEEVFDGIIHHYH